MDIREFSSAYARSPLGLGSILASLAAGTAAGLLGSPLALSALVAIASFALLGCLALAFGFGQRAASGELDREAGAEAAARLGAASQARHRLASLRLAQAEVASARDLLVLEAGRLIEDCGRAGTYDPEGVAAVLDSLALVDAWLKEEDESSLEKRFALPGAHLSDAAARTAQALRDKALVVAARRSAALGEIPAADRLAIEEELK
jgi:hypothetical protein